MWVFEPLLENATPQKVLVVVIGFLVVTWVGGLAKGTAVSNGELVGIAAIVVAYAIVDHLHGIRQALDQLNREKLDNERGVR